MLASSPTRKSHCAGLVSSGHTGADLLSAVLQRRHTQQVDEMLAAMVLAAGAAAESWDV